MIIAVVFIVVVLAFVFRRRIHRWLENFEGPIARLRNNGNDQDEMQAQNVYNYNNMQMAPPNINYSNPNTSYQNPPPQYQQVYPHYQHNNIPSPPLPYYIPRPPPQSNPYETNPVPLSSQSQLNDN